jgi:major type 1 subunit fimbrin (pilin)
MGCFFVSGACAAYDGINCNPTSIPVTTIVEIPVLKLAADAPIGTVLWRRTRIPFSTNCSLRFMSGDKEAFLFRQFLALANYGLSFDLTYRGNKGDAPASIGTGITVDKFHHQGGNEVSGTVDLELRKSGATPSQGSVSFPSLLAFKIADHGRDDISRAYSIGGLNNISFINYTCDIDTRSRNIFVPLGNIRVDKFTGIGSTSPDQKFNLGLTCSQPAGAYNLALTFSAATDPSKVPGVLALTGGAAAAGGVGIQLLMNSRPVEFGTALPADSATAGASLAIPMAARYYQTADTVKPGRADGIATFVVTYK